MANNSISRVETTGAGQYTLPNLPVGLYELTVESSGFKKYMRANIYWIGMAYQGMGNQERARQAWTRAAEARAPGVQACYRALALQRLGEAEKGTAQQPYVAGLAHLGLGETAQASEELQKALAANPAHAAARFTLEELR